MSIGTIHDDRTNRADDVLRRAVELAATATPTEDAATVLAATGATAADIREAQAALLSGLARNPFFDPTGVRAARMLYTTLDLLAGEQELATAA